MDIYVYIVLCGFAPLFVPLGEPISSTRVSDCELLSSISGFTGNRLTSVGERLPWRLVEVVALELIKIEAGEVVAVGSVEPTVVMAVTLAEVDCVVPSSANWLGEIPVIEEYIKYREVCNHTRRLVCQSQ